MRRTDTPDSGPIFRSHRVYFAGDGWWVATREDDRGPFPERRLADLDARNYSRRMRQLTADGGSVN